MGSSLHCMHCVGVISDNFFLGPAKPVSNPVHVNCMIKVIVLNPFEEINPLCPSIIPAVAQ